MTDTISGQIDEVCLITSLIYHVVIQIDPNILAFKAGQYFYLYYPDGSADAFSCANADAKNGKVSFLIRYDKSNGVMSRWLSALRSGDPVSLSGPYGNCFYRTGKSSEALVLIAAGVGIGQCKAIVEQALITHDPRAIYFYGLYNDAEGEALSRFLLRAIQSDAIHYKMICAKLHDERLMRWHLQYANDHDPEQNHTYFLSGPWSFVDKVVESLIQRGVSKAAMHSDRFDFE